MSVWFMLSLVSKGRAVVSDLEWPQEGPDLISVRTECKIWIEKCICWMGVYVSIGLHAIEYIRGHSKALRSVGAYYVPRYVFSF
jgi:hypothetical protein